MWRRLNLSGTMSPNTKASSSILEVKLLGKEGRRRPRKTFLGHIHRKMEYEYYLEKKWMAKDRGVRLYRYLICRCSMVEADLFNANTHVTWFTHLRERRMMSRGKLCSLNGIGFWANEINTRSVQRWSKQTQFGLKCITLLPIWEISLRFKLNISYTNSYCLCRNCLF